MPKPPTIADLTWTGGLQFAAPSGTASRASAERDRETVAAKPLIIDGDSSAGPSPVQILAYSLAGCMSADLVHILTKARHPLRALRAHLVGHRAADDPHRFVRIELHFTVEGAVPAEAIERALSLSREKYCSVWHSMRQDIDFQVTFDRVG